MQSSATIPSSFVRAFVRAAIGTSLFGALAAGQAFAQSSEGSGELQEVVVTAQFREQRLQDTPLAITAEACPAAVVRGTAR